MVPAFIHILSQYAALEYVSVQQNRTGTRPQLNFEPDVSHETSTHSDEASATISVFASMVAAILATIYYSARAGFSDNSITTVFEILGVSWFLIHFPFGFRFVASRFRSRRAESWVTSDGVLALLGLLLLTLTGLLTPYTGMSLGSLFAAVGTILFVCRIIRWLTVAHFLNTAFLIVGGGLLSLNLAASVWSAGFLHPLFLQALGQGRWLVDSLFHMSISNMIRTYGVPSTGLDGIPFLHYHFGSHFVFAQMCNVLDVGVDNFYNLGYPVIFIPFYLYSLLLFAIQFADLQGSDKIDRRLALRSNFLFWFILLVGHVGFLQPYQISTEMLKTEVRITLDFLLSESFAVAITISFLSLSALMSFLCKTGTILCLPTPRAVIATIVVVSGMLFIIGLFKITIMIVLLAVACFIYIRLGLFRKWKHTAILTVAFCSCLLSYRLFFKPPFTEAMNVSLFWWFRVFTSPEWWPFVFLLHWFWVWAFLSFRLRQKKIYTLADLLSAIRRREIVDLELLVVAGILSAVPALLIANHAVKYFLDYPRWLALGMFLGAIVISRDMNSGSTGTLSYRLGSLQINQILLLVIGVSVAASMLLTTYTLTRRMVSAVVAARGLTNKGVQTEPQVREWRSSLIRALRAGEITTTWDILHRQASSVENRLETGKKIVGELQKLGNLSRSEKRQTLLYIPKSNLAYWELFERGYQRKATAFVAPAITGMAMIDGLPERDPELLWYGHGYEMYEFPSVPHTQPPLSFYQEKLCKRAVSMGFSRILVLDFDDKTGGRQTTLRCR